MSKHQDPRDDAKAEALRRQGELHCRPDDVQDELFRTNEFFDPRDLVQVKYEMLRRARSMGCRSPRQRHRSGSRGPCSITLKKRFRRLACPA